jgi:transposase
VIPRWYTTQQLAQRAGVSQETVRWWLWRARRAGFAPSPDQYAVRRLNAFRRTAAFREDFALRLLDRWTRRLVY